MFNLSTKEDVRILHRRIDELVKNMQALERYCNSMADCLGMALEDIRSASLNKVTFHGKAIKKGGKKRD